jgi:signal transduction histidine kinase
MTDRLKQQLVEVAKLAYDKDIINAHNGIVMAESSIGVGTKITIKFPKKENI